MLTDLSTLIGSVVQVVFLYECGCEAGELTERVHGARVHRFPSERAMLQGWRAWLQARDPDAFVLFEVRHGECVLAVTVKLNTTFKIEEGHQDCARQTFLCNPAGEGHAGCAAGALQGVEDRRRRPPHFQAAGARPADHSLPIASANSPRPMHSVQASSGLHI